MVVSVVLSGCHFLRENPLCTLMKSSVQPLCVLSGACCTHTWEYCQIWLFTEFRHMFFDQILRIRPCKFPVKLVWEVFQLVVKFFLWPLANHCPNQTEGVVPSPNLCPYSLLYGTYTPNKEQEWRICCFFVSSFFPENIIFLNHCNGGWN